MEIIKRLFTSRKFLLVLAACVQTIAFQFFPTVKEEVWLSINALIGVLITMIAVEDAAQGFGAATMAAKLEIARIESAAVVSAASVTAKPALASAALVAEVPVTLTEKAAAK